MDIFKNIFKTNGRDIKYLTPLEIEERNKEFKVKYDKVKELLENVLYNYNSSACQCAFPRFQQLIGINCTDSRNSFKCYDTDLLIDLSSSYFTIIDSQLTDESSNKKWVCIKCGSTYEYGWSDFSIYVERQKLTLTNLKTSQIGKPALTPIPLYLGLMGHSYPEQDQMIDVDFDEFKKYITEQ